MKKYLILLTAALFCANTSLAASGCESCSEDATTFSIAGSTKKMVIGARSDLGPLLDFDPTIPGNMPTKWSLRPTEAHGGPARIMLSPVVIDGAAYDHAILYTLQKEDGTGANKIIIDRRTKADFTYSDILEMIHRDAVAAPAAGEGYHEGSTVYLETTRTHRGIDVDMMGPHAEIMFFLRKPAIPEGDFNGLFRLAE